MSVNDNSFRRLGRDTALYGLTGVLARVVSIVMLPVYTRFLSPAQYGVLQLLEVTTEITFILFIAGTRSGLLRFYYRAESEEKRLAVVFSTFVLEVSLATAGALVLALAAYPVWRVVLVPDGSPGLIRLAALNFAVGALAFTPLSLLQTERRAGAFAGVQLVKLGLQVAGNVYFLVYMGMGVRGMMLSGIIVNSAVGLGLAGWLLSRTGFRLSLDALRDVRRFGVPYQVTTAGAFILTFGDRFFIKRYSGAAQVGVYGIAYQFGFLLYHLGAAPFLRAWDPQRFQTANLPAAQRDAQYSKGFFWFNVILLSVATAIAVSVRPALTILTPEPFHSAVRLVPLILAVYVLHSWVEAVKFGIDVTEQTRYYTYASWIAVVVVLILYVTLIPRFGGVGAALATLGAFLVRFGLTLHWSQRLWPVRYGWPRVLRLVSLAGLISTTAALIRPPAIGAQIVVGLSLFAVYAIALWYLILDSEEREALLDVSRLRSIRQLLGRA